MSHNSSTENHKKHGPKICQSGIIKVGGQGFDKNYCIIFEIFVWRSLNYVCS